MQDVHAEQSPRKSWTKPALIVSVALNLVVVGLIAGAVLRHEGSGPRGPKAPSFAAFGHPYIAALSREDRREIFKTMRQQQSDGDFPNRAARRALFSDVIKALETSPFDPEALRRAVSTQAAVSIEVQRRAQAAWLTHVSKMSDAERAAYAEAVLESAKRGRKRPSDSQKDG